MANEGTDPVGVDPENEIRHPRSRTRQPRPADPTAQVGSTEKNESPKRSRHPVPSHVRERFVNVGKVYYFPDGAKAFEDHGRRLSTPSENTEVIASLIAIAEARGWQRITVSGSEKFRGEVWRQANLKGIAVRGYAATPVEKARLAQRLAHVSIAPEATDQPKAQEQAKPPDTPAREASGELLAFGTDRYRHHAQGPMSYFMRIRTAEGERTAWGRDLERAAREAHVRVGDSVRLILAGRDPVTISTRDPDSGSIRSESRYRNRWTLEKVGPVAAQSPLAPTAGAVDDALTVRQAELLAAAHLKPEERMAFVQAVRTTLETQRALGDASPSPRLRDREPPEPSRERAL